MTVSFGRSDELSRLEGAVQSMQENGAGRVDEGWSDVEKIAFASVAASFGLTDADAKGERDGRYEYDGKTKGPTGNEADKALEDALTEAANSVAVEAATDAGDTTAALKDLAAINKFLGVLTQTRDTTVDDPLAFAPLVNAQEVGVIGTSAAVATNVLVAPGAVAAVEQHLEVPSELENAGYDFTDATEEAVENVAGTGAEAEAYAEDIKYNAKKDFGIEPQETPT